METFYRAGNDKNSKILKWKLHKFTQMSLLTLKSYTSKHKQFTSEQCSGSEGNSVMKVIKYTMA